MGGRINTEFSASRRLRERANTMIPGGCHTYAKGDDQYPALAPSHLVRGKGCRVWDVDGNEYIEYGMGNRTVTLGHGYEPVLAAVRSALEDGVSFSRPAAIEVAAAEAFLAMIGDADMVKFCKDGSDATSGAVKLARAHTGRDLVAVCADHPFFSVDDWFIGSTAMHGGIPEATRALTVKFRYNDIASVDALLAQYPGQIACFILEPSRTEAPRENFLQALRERTHRVGALLILDEMITGFRLHCPGAQHLYGVQPDLSTWGKAIANGFSVSALTGKREYMRLGDLEQVDKPRVFLLSTTHGGETHGLAAMMATLETYRREPVVEHMYRVGERLRTGCAELIARHGLKTCFAVEGPASNLLFVARDQHGEPSQALRTLFIQECIRRGVTLPSLVVSYAHTDDDIDQTLEAIDGALGVYAQALNEGVARYLVGRPSIPVYRTFNPKSSG